MRHVPCLSLHRIAGSIRLLGLAAVTLPSALPLAAQAEAATAAAPVVITSCDPTTIQNALSRGGEYSIRCSGNIGPRLVSGAPASFSVPAGKVVKLVNDSGSVVRLTASGNGDCVRTLRVKGTLTLEGVDIRGGSTCGADGKFGALGRDGDDGVRGSFGGDHVTRDGGPGTPGGAGTAGANGSSGGTACGGGIYVDSTGVLNLLRVEVNGNFARGGNGGTGGRGGNGGRGGGGGQGSFTYTAEEGAPGNGGPAAAGGDGANGGNGGRGGAARGAGVCSFGTLNIADSRFVANTVQAGNGQLGGAGGNGGVGGDGGQGEFNTAAGTCEPNAAQIRGGNGSPGATGGKGGLAGKPGAGGEARGAAIYSEGPITVSNTVFQANRAVAGNGGLGQNGGDGGAGGLGGSGERGHPNGIGAAGGNGGNGGARSSGGKGGSAFGAAIATANGGGATLSALSFVDDAIQPGTGGAVGNRIGAGGRGGAGGNDAYTCSTPVPARPRGADGLAASDSAKAGSGGLSGAPELDLR